MEDSGCNARSYSGILDAARFLYFQQAHGELAGPGSRLQPSPRWNLPFRRWDGRMQVVTACLTSPTTQNCPLATILLHFLNPEGKIHSASFVSQIPFAQTVPGCTGKPSPRRLKWRCCLCFQQTPWQVNCHWTSSELLIFLENHSIVCFKNAPRLPVSPVQALDRWWSFIYFQSFQIPAHSCDLGQGRGHHLNGYHSPFIIQ